MKHPNAPPPQNDLKHPQTQKEDWFNSMVNPLFAGFSASETLLMNGKAKRLEMEGKDIFKFGFGQSLFPIPPLVQQRLRDRVERANMSNDPVI